MRLRIPRVVLGGCALAGALFLADPVTAADAPLTLEDVLRMHRAGLSDNIIASEVLVTESVFELTPDELIRLKEMGLSEELIQFLVDTGLPPEEGPEAADDAATGDTDYDEADQESYAHLWVNVIEEEPSTTYFVTLDYDYPTWWYRSYWHDYWYYDFHFHPYRFSYSWTCGTWYPTWYTYRSCYLPSYWGYRSNYWAWSGYHWGYRSCPTYYAGYYAAPRYYTDRYDHSHALSRTKYKTGGSSGKVLYTDAGLKVPDFRRPTRTIARADDRVPVDGGKRPTRQLLAVDDRRPVLKDGPRRPIRSTPTLDERRPTRPQRRPALEAPTRKVTRRPDEPVRVDNRRADDRRPPTVRTPIRTPATERPRPSVRTTPRNDDRGRVVRPPDSRTTERKDPPPATRRPARPVVKDKDPPPRKVSEPKPAPPPQRERVRSAPPRQSSKGSSSKPPPRSEPPRKRTKVRR